MRVHEVRSIEMDAPYEKAFEFIADPRNLPRWAHAFERVEGTTAQLRTPSGLAAIELSVDASARYGTIDWQMTFSDAVVATAMSRLTRAPESRLVYTFVLHAPPVPLEEIEGALAEQVLTLESELAQLRGLLTQ